MNSENIKKVTNQGIEQLITTLNEGRSETLTQYLAAIGRFHRHSLRNVMLIASQKPTATHVADFHAWHKLGRFVMRGEKGILILAPIVRRKNESPEQNETDESSTPVGFRAAYVFHQPDGRPRTSHNWQRRRRSSGLLWATVFCHFLGFVGLCVTLRGFIWQNSKSQDI